MKISTAYISFSDLVNRNTTNNNINVDKPRFVTLFNSVAIKYEEWILEHRNLDKIRNISNLLVLDQPLQKKKEAVDHTLFSLPTDFFDLSNLKVYGSKGKCVNQRLFTEEVKSEDTEELFRDENRKPSFEFREVYYFLSAKDSVAIFKDNFNIDDAILTYYRYPKKVDIAGYIKEDGTASQDIDPEFDERSTNYILEAMAKAFSVNNDDTQAYQLNKDRLFTNI